MVLSNFFNFRSKDDIVNVLILYSVMKEFLLICIEYRKKLLKKI